MAARRGPRMTMMRWCGLSLSLSMGLALASSHYESPPCKSDDEVKAKIQGSGGSACVPECTSAAACPADKPTGVTAKPECVLEEASSGKKYCALVCSTDSECGAHQDVVCAKIAIFIGVCVYRSAASEAADNVGQSLPELKTLPALAGLLGYEPYITEAQHKSAFLDFQRTYGKRYVSEQEEAARFNVFKENSLFIRQQNKMADGAYTLAVNEYADMTWPEFKAGFVGYRSDLRQQRWGELAYLGEHKVGDVDKLPKSVDWTTKGAVTKVKNQGSCGSCWSFSTTGALEGAWELATGKLVSLSEQQFVDCSSKYGNMACQGGLMDNAFKYAEKNALCTEDSYPYKAKAEATCGASNCTVGIPKHGVVGFKDVPKDSPSALMDALAQNPVSVAIEADKQVFQFYNDGVLTATCGSQLDHGVLAVGYGTWKDGTDYWKVKNSWGPTWGQEGFILLKRGKEKAVPGECGILKDPSYPVVNGKAPPSPAPGPSPAPPGPAPGPSPPSPPSPTPSGGHYEKPPCHEDEVRASVEGAGGAVCAPPCGEDDVCPEDAPTGTLAVPMCSLHDSISGKKYCALMCTDDSDCAAGATCAQVDVLGVCVYPAEQQAKTQDGGLVLRVTETGKSSEATAQIMV